MPYQSACATAGTGYTTFNRYRKERPAFALQVEQAREKLRQKCFRTFHRAMDEGDWRAADVMLKHAFPEYRQQAQTEVNVTTQIENVCTEEQRARILSVRLAAISSSKPKQEQITDENTYN